MTEIQVIDRLMSLPIDYKRKHSVNGVVVRKVSSDEFVVDGNVLMLSNVIDLCAEHHEEAQG